MWPLLIAVVLVCALIWVRVRWSRLSSYWALRQVPHAPAAPLFGSFTFLQKKNPAIWFREIYDEFRSPYVGIWVFCKPGLVVNSPEIARRILVKDAEIFRDRFLGSGKSDPMGSLNLFSVNDPLWTSLRRRFTPIFTAAKLRALHGLVSTKASELVQRIRTETEENKRIDIRAVYSDYTTDIIGTAAFGVVCDATRTGEGAIRSVTKEFMEYSWYRGISWSSIFFIPGLVDIFGFKMFPQSTIDFLRKVFRSIVAQRGGYDREDETNNDLLDALLNIKKKADKEGEDISEDLLIAQAFIFLQGGFDTSAVTLTYATYELAFQPHMQDRAYGELMAAKKKNDGADLYADQLAELTYFNSIIKEVLRKYPAMGWLDRKASKDYKIDDKLTISAGTPVYVNAVGMHYDALYYPEPEKFNPDRFLPENEHNLTPFTFLTFGEGPRHCIGERFAYQNLRLGLASLILNFEFRPWPDAKLPSDCELEKNGLFLMPADVLSVNFIPRN